MYKMLRMVLAAQYILTVTVAADVIVTRLDFLVH